MTKRPTVSRLLLQKRPPGSGVIDRSTICPVSVRAMAAGISNRKGIARSVGPGDKPATPRRLRPADAGDSLCWSAMPVEDIRPGGADDPFEASATTRKGVATANSTMTAPTASRKSVRMIEPGQPVHRERSDRVGGVFY